MESFPEQRLNALQADPKTGCGRAGCACGLPVSERFVLWAPHRRRFVVMCHGGGLLQMLNQDWRVSVEGDYSKLGGAAR